MVDIVDVGFTLSNLDQMPNGFNEIFMCQHTQVSIHNGLKIQLLVDFVPSNPTEVITARIKEKSTQKLFGIGGSRRVTRPNTVVNVLERLIRTVRRI